MTVPVTYDLNNINDVNSLLDDKDFMGYMRDYFAKNLPPPTPEKPISDSMAISILKAPFGNLYTNYGSASYPASFVREAIEGYQKWTGGAKSFKFADNGVTDSSRRFGQAGWVATAFAQATYVAGTTNRGSDWDKALIARAVLYAATEATFLAKNLWYVHSQRSIKANWNTRIEGLKALGKDATSLETSKNLANARLDFKNAAFTSAGLAVFTALGAVGIARNLATDFAGEKDPVLRMAAQLALAGSFLNTTGNGVNAIGNGLGVLEKHTLIRELLRGVSAPLTGGSAGGSAGAGEGFGVMAR